MPFVQTWNTERDARLTALHSQVGEPSFSEIAAALNAEFGTSLSRNACIGRASRLKLSKRTSIVRSEFEKQKKPRAPRPPREHKQRDRYNPASRRIMPIFESAETIKLRCVEIEPRHLALLDLEKNDCRYPYGDGPITITFCGHPKMAGTSYCTAHFHLTRGAGTSSERAATKVSTSILAVA